MYKKEQALYFAFHFLIRRIPENVGRFFNVFAGAFPLRVRKMRAFFAFHFLIRRTRKNVGENLSLSGAIMPQRMADVK